jgi:Na+/melibiose symporter-like transporter
LLGDIIDFDRWKTGEDRAGAYFAVFLFAVKLNTALGGAAAFFLLDLTGYDAAAGSQSAFASLGIRLAFAIVPGILFLVGCAVMWTYPLTRARHQEILAELEVRSAELAKDGRKEKAVAGSAAPATS